jgi:hypothetical protein
MFPDGVQRETRKDEPNDTRQGCLCLSLGRQVASDGLAAGKQGNAGCKIAMRWGAPFQTAPRMAVRPPPALVDSGRLARPKSCVPDGGAARKMTPRIMSLRRNDLRAVDIELPTGSNLLRPTPLPRDR